MKNPLNKMEILLMWLRKEFPQRRWQRETWSERIYMKRNTRFSPPGPKYDLWEFFRVSDNLGSNVICHDHGHAPHKTLSLADPSCLRTLKRHVNTQLKKVDKWYVFYAR